MLRNQWSFALALYHEDGAPIGRLPIEVDWEPARQWARHVALCEGRTIRERSDEEVCPIWRRDAGPTLRGFRISIDTDGHTGGITCEFPSAYFSGAAHALSAPLVEAGHLREGERFGYIVLAYPCQPADGPPRPTGFAVKDVTPAPALSEASMEELFRRSTTIGESVAGEIPVFAPAGVLDEIAALTRRASPLETGGALVGHLHRDPGAHVVFTRITAQVPARHTQASAVRLAFTSDTWHDLRQALHARGNGELMLGWWHSHPVHEWRRQNWCPEAQRDRCAVAVDLFSEHDRAVHRTVFPGAHSIAVVASHVSAADVRFSAYGWSLGMLVSRGLCVLEDAS
jgi:proteasome lid subunit RPN8/RPN11